MQIKAELSSWSAHTKLMPLRYKKGMWAIFLVLVLYISNPSAGLGANGDRIGAWTGKHTRLVWLQDQGDGADTLAHGQNLMLFGYDSTDGRGERPLLPKTSNYFRPMITPDGQQVVFSNRLTRQMYLLDWDSGAVHELGEGVAVAVWEDPKPTLFLRRTKTWIYCFTGQQPENEYGTSQPLYRFQLEQPKKKELIWDKTNMAWDNIQLSRDGRVLSGLFPWPDGGVLLTRKKSWHRLGNGCWTSLSPDNSKLLWIFDGFHRNIQVHDIVNGKEWAVNINSAPGIDGFEVYHPRWSNHPRYFVMTGPYEKGEGGNRIRGGGEKVEVYIGRFDEKAQSVEDWLKATENGRADFFPDLWIEDGDKADLTVKSGKPTVRVEKESWPRVRENLAFVWENMKAANQLDEKSPVGFSQCNLVLRGRALYTRQLQLATTGGFAETAEAGKNIGAALARSGQGSVEFILTLESGRQGTILSFAGGGKEQLQLVLEGEDLVVHSAASTSKALWSGLFTTGRAQHLVANFDGKYLEIFIDGLSAGKKEMNINLAGMALDTFRLGDRTGSLQAVLSGVAVYNKELKQAEITANSRLAHARVDKTKPADILVIEGAVQETSEIPAPDAIGAYRRALVVNTYSVKKVIQGEYRQKRILVAEWAILDRNIIKSYQTPAQLEQLVLEKMSDNPQLEGERQMMDVFEPELEMYYRLPQVVAK
ncbi:MAG: LamG-like jellyroll fold domain-containing protein [Pseudomonadota bacterium]